MLSVRPLAAPTIAAVELPAEPNPMFSPADVHCTPWAVNRAPRPASPGHWWDSPQPLIMSWLWSSEALDKLVLRVSGLSPFCARAALMWASTWSTMPLGVVWVGGLVLGLV